MLSAGSGATILTFAGAGTIWLAASPAITASAGTLGALTVLTNTSATATYTPPATAQNVVFTDATDNNTTIILSVTSLAALISVSPGTVAAGAGGATVTFTGVFTSWGSASGTYGSSTYGTGMYAGLAGAAPTIPASAGVLGTLTVTSTTTATATYTPPATAQNVTFTDSTDNNTSVLLSVTVIPLVIPPQVGVAPPALVIEVSFNTNPTDPPVWIDITRYVQGQVSINRGRQRELDRVQAGVMTLELDNRDRRFDPTFPGPYTTGILPMRRIRARATYANTSYPLFSGYVESWGQSWKGWQDATVPVVASDAFKPLNLAQLNTSFPVQSSSARVNAVLDSISWTSGGAAWLLGTSLLGTATTLGPTGDRIVSPGSSTIQASTLANTSALAHLQDVTDTEMGLLFADKTGVVNFYGRSYATNTNMGTFGELELPYVDLQMDYSDTNIWNDIEITRQGGTQQRATNTLSQQQYYKRTLSKTSTLQNTDAEALSLATAMVARYAQPTLQILAITLDGEAQPATIYPQMLAREIGDRVTVRRRPPGGGPIIEQASLIQGVNTTFDVAGGVWLTTWRLAPSDSTVYWKLGDSALGLLGSTTRLFF